MLPSEVIFRCVEAQRKNDGNVDCATALSAKINLIGGAHTEMGPLARMMVSHD